MSFLKTGLFKAILVIFATVSLIRSFLMLRSASVFSLFDFMGSTEAVSVLMSSLADGDLQAASLMDLTDSRIMLT